MATLSAYDAGMPEFYITPPVKSQEVQKSEGWPIVPTSAITASTRSERRAL